MVHGPVAMSEKSKQLLAKLQQNKEETEAIQALWRSFGSGFTPPDYLQCSIWLQRHDLETVIYGLSAMSGHMNRKRQAELPDFASAVTVAEANPCSLNSS